MAAMAINAGVINELPIMAVSTDVASPVTCGATSLVIALPAAKLTAARVVTAVHSLSSTPHGTASDLTRSELVTVIKLGQARARRDRNLSRPRWRRI
jgi:hypothetical protein